LSEPAKLQDLAHVDPSDASLQVADANRRALDLMFGAQRLVLEELVFVAEELLDRTRTETHLFAEFISKLAGSHSVRDWQAMGTECTRHQLDFIRRDCDRLFRHGERMVTAGSSLISASR
jgi:hypothetical protein